MGELGTTSLDFAHCAKFSPSPHPQCLSLKFSFICNFSDAFPDKGGQATWMLGGKKVHCATSFLDDFHQEFGQTHQVLSKGR